MGTLFKQEVRRRYSIQRNTILDKIAELKIIAKESGLSIDQVIEVKKVLEQERTNDLYVVNGDVFDEQMAGFGELALRLTNRFKKLVKYAKPKKVND